MLWEIASWDTELLRQIAGSNVLLCQHRLSGLMFKAEPWEQRGLTLHTLANRLQKQKARSNPYMVIFTFIGYFTLVLRDFLPSSCSDFSGLISLLCHPYLPATFSGLRPRLFSFDPPLCYISLRIATIFKLSLFLHYFRNTMAIPLMIFFQHFLACR
jgi:hypothetical protein